MHLSPLISQSFHVHLEPPNLKLKTKIKEKVTPLLSHSYLSITHSFVIVPLAAEVCHAVYIFALTALLEIFIAMSIWSGSRRLACAPLSTLDRH